MAKPCVLSSLQSLAELPRGIPFGQGLVESSSQKRVMNDRSIVAALVIGLLIASSIAVYQQALVIAPLESKQPSTLTLTETLTVNSSEFSGQLFGINGVVHIIAPNDTGTMCYCFSYFRANGSDEKSFYSGFSFVNQSGTYFHSANFSEVGTTQEMEPDSGLVCKSYTITFQITLVQEHQMIGYPTSENLGVCAIVGQLSEPPSYSATGFNFTRHTEPQAGLAYSPEGVLYFLVSQS
jgi:hypothetical protein